MTPSPFVDLLSSIYSWGGGPPSILFRTHPPYSNPLRHHGASFFSSYRPPVQLSSYLPHAFRAYLVFRGPAKTAKSKSMAFILIVAYLLVDPVPSATPALLFGIMPSFVDSFL
jgi:hypothetical protein